MAKDKNKGRATIQLKDVEVVYAAVTGEGVLNKKAKKNQYSLAILVDEATKKDILKTVKKMFEKDAPCDEWDNDPEKWFKEDDDGKGYVLFLNCAIDDESKYPLVRQRKQGTSWKLKHFETMGKGSRVDVKFNVYVYGDEDECGVGRALNAILLREWVEYTGGGIEGGENIDVDSDIPAPSSEDKALVEEIEEAIGDGDKKTAKKLLKKLDESHAKFAELKKLIKKL